ncbi:MAG: M20/M25/M40 family metallo-hydrolase [Gammaproteobacteria bacterium]|nr:M20/M25/M40 family metallo-hydrolase [Gammaproteobacteria bacterium]
MSLRFPVALASIAVLSSVTTAVHADSTLRPDQLAYRELFRELVETNTTLSSGSCTLAADRMAARLRKAGMPEKDIHLFAVPEHPKEGGLVAVLPGTDASAKPILLLAHIDVVEAKREDWTRDPFTLVEENGYFYARGVADDKAMASIWVDTLVRFLQQGYKPRRTVKMALTCGEETSGAFNGAEYLSTQQRELIDAAFALNEGAWGTLDDQGRRVMITVQAGEKASQNYRLEVRNPGGHSSRPVKDNAIYRLANGLIRLSQYDFPIHLNDTTREYFTRMADIKGGDLGAAMRALVKDPTDARAVATVTADPTWNAMLRTTCVATMMEAGHATNALPQRAQANVNCRVHPVESFEDVRQALVRIVADPAIEVTKLETRGPQAKAPPLTPEILRPIEQIAARIYPGVPLLPLFQAGATDAQFLGAAGIPTYGIGVLFFEPDLGGVHGLNERIRVQSLYEGRDFLYDLVKAYANQ